jgi:hypothetical protein
LKGKRLNALALKGSAKTTVLLEVPEALDAEIIQEDQKVAKAEAEYTKPGITMFTYGSRLDSGAASMQSYGRMGNPGWESKTTWDTTKKPTTQNTQHWQVALRGAAKRQMAPEKGHHFQ